MTPSDRRRPPRHTMAIVAVVGGLAAMAGLRAMRDSPGSTPVYLAAAVLTTAVLASVVVTVHTTLSIVDGEVRPGRTADSSMRHTAALVVLFFIPVFILFTDADWAAFTAAGDGRASTAAAQTGNLWLIVPALLAAMVVAVAAERDAVATMIRAGPAFRRALIRTTITMVATTAAAVGYQQAAGFAETPPIEAPRPAGLVFIVATPALAAAVAASRTRPSPSPVTDDRPSMDDQPRQTDPDGRWPDEEHDQRAGNGGRHGEA